MSDTGKSYPTDGEILDVVDLDDNVVSTCDRKTIHEKGLTHRAVHVFVFNSLGEIYVQRRSASKDRHPLELDSSAAGHVDSGETYDETARRELEEELGLKADPKRVFWVKACEETDNEHVALYKVITDDTPHPDQEEVAGGAFMTPEELTESMRRTPNEFVPAFRRLWGQYRELTD